MADRDAMAVDSTTALDILAQVAPISPRVSPQRLGSPPAWGSAEVCFLMGTDYPPRPMAYKAQEAAHDCGWWTVWQTAWHPVVVAIKKYARLGAHTCQGKQ